MPLRTTRLLVSNLLFALSMLPLYVDASNVTVVYPELSTNTDMTLRQAFALAGKLVVFLCMPDNPVCDYYYQEWDQFITMADNLGLNLALAKVNCDKDTDVCKGILCAPAVRVFESYPCHHKTYYGRRNATMMLDVIARDLGVLPTPTVAPTRQPFGSFSLAAPSTLEPSSAPSPDVLDSPYEACSNRVSLHEVHGTQMYRNEPIEIVAQNETTVSFAVKQTWADSPICFIATDFDKGGGERVCERHDATKPGEFAVFTAECTAEHTDVNIFMHWKEFDPVLDNAVIPEHCGVIPDDGHKVSYHYRIPCASAGSSVAPCGQEEHNAVCKDSVLILDESFDGEQAALDWILGKQGDDARIGRFLGPLGTDTKAVAKTFRVPTATTQTRLNFDVYVFDSWSEGDTFFLRVGRQYLNLGSLLGVDETKHFMDVIVDIHALEKHGSLLKVYISATVPQRWYPEGRLVVGFQVDLDAGSDKTRSLGIDNVQIKTACSS